MIMGCGRVGSTLAKSLSKRGHDVAIIDAEPAAFRRLGAVRGHDRHRDRVRPRHLKAARIDEAYAFAAVSSGDNSNILAARVARETFGVEHVAARIYDPRPRRGLPAARHSHGGDRALDRRPDAAPALPEGAVPRWRDPSGKVVAGRGAR